MRAKIGEIYAESRLLAKTINRIIIDNENNVVDWSPWRNEAKLLGSAAGSCLSSTTLLVKSHPVPTYGFNGRCYGILFDAMTCNIYDVNSTDSNSQRELKLQKRQDRKNINLLTSNRENIKTLDDLSAEIKHSAHCELNEVLLDAWQNSCVGLFVRKIETNNYAAQQYYYTSLLEIMLIQKYLTETFGFQNLIIYQYDETQGKFYTFPKKDELYYICANYFKINAKTEPVLFKLLSDSYHFNRIKSPGTVGEYLSSYNGNAIKDKIIALIIQKFQPFDSRIIDTNSILQEYVDDIIGVPEELIQEASYEAMNSVAKYTMR